MKPVPEPLPPKEAIRFWQDKVRLSPGQFRRLADAARTKAFAVAGIARGAELETVFSAMSRAIAKGTSFADFKRDCEQIFARRGWTGRRAWRVDNIFRTNIQTAYSVGRYKQAMPLADRFFGQYDAVGDVRTRPTHAALDGKIFPLNHPFWNTWWPPNGFRCRCSVIYLHKYTVEEEGLKVESDDPTGKLIEPVDPVTGQKMPARPLMPDTGFAHHPGKTVWGGIVDAAAARDDGRLRQCRPLPGAADYRLPAARNMKRLAFLPKLLPSTAELKAEGMSNRQIARYYQEQFQQAFGMKDGEKVFFIDGEPLIISERVVFGRKGRFKLTKGDRGRFIPCFVHAVSDPDEVWLTPMIAPDGRWILRRRHLKFYRHQERNLGIFCVLDIDGGTWTGVTIYDVESGQSGPAGQNLLDGPLGYRRGVLLYRKR